MALTLLKMENRFSIKNFEGELVFHRIFSHTSQTIFSFFPLQQSRIKNWPEKVDVSN
jgi:hypothetical protein